MYVSVCVSVCLMDACGLKGSSRMDFNGALSEFAYPYRLSLRRLTLTSTNQSIAPKTPVCIQVIKLAGQMRGGEGMHVFVQRH